MPAEPTEKGLELESISKLRHIRDRFIYYSDMSDDGALRKEVEQGLDAYALFVKEEQARQMLNQSEATALLGLLDAAHHLTTSTKPLPSLSISGHLNTLAAMAERNGPMHMHTILSRILLFTALEHAARERASILEFVVEAAHVAWKLGEVVPLVRAEIARIAAASSLVDDWQAPVIVAVTSFDDAIHFIDAILLAYERAQAHSDPDGGTKVS